jgi:hypothetical protein
MSSKDLDARWQWRIWLPVAIGIAAAVAWTHFNLPVGDP